MSELIEELSSSSGLNKNILEQIQQFANECNIEKVILFGSRAKGNYCRTSDIDIAISGGDKTSFYFKIEDEVDSLLLFDIVDLEVCDQDFNKEINNYGKIIFQKI